MRTKQSPFAYSRHVMSEFIDRLEVMLHVRTSMGNIVSETMHVAMPLAYFGDKSRSDYGKVVALMQPLETELS